MIDTTKKVRFYSDTGKSHYPDHIMKEVLFEDDLVCLCESTDFIYILFHKISHEVLTSDLMYYYAENFE